MFEAIVRDRKGKSQKKFQQHGVKTNIGDPMPHGANNKTDNVVRRPAK